MFNTVTSSAFCVGLVIGMLIGGFVVNAILSYRMKEKKGG